MNRIVLLFSAIFLFAIKTDAQWTGVSTGTTSMYESIYFFDANNGIASSTNDVIKTSNGGTNWTKVSTAGIRDIDFVNSTVGYAAGLSGTSLYKTTNGGSTWSSLTPLGSNVLWGVSAVDASTVYVCGASGAVWKTTNGGTSFSSVNISTTNTIIDLQFVSATEGCALEVTGNVWRTTNGGTTWTETFSTVGVYFTSIFFVNTTVGYAVGSSGTIIKTTDGGASWTTQTSNSTNYLQYVDFYDANNGIVSGLNGVVLRTMNGGALWFPENTWTTMSLYCCILLSPTSALAGGINGTMLKNTSLGNGFEQFSLNDDISVYPDPAQNSLMLNISDNDMIDYDISIFNMQGQLLYSQTISQALTVIDITSLARGVYYIRVENKDSVGVKKFVKE